MNRPLESRLYAAGVGQIGEARAGARVSLAGRAFGISSAERLREMSERRQQHWSLWVAKGAVAMAVLAALALALGLLLTQRALDNAAAVVIRGDGDTLVNGVVVDLWEARSPLTTDALGALIAKHYAEGLRYLALVDRQDHHVIVGAGAAAIARPAYLPGEVARQGRRVRLVALIPPRAETHAASDPAAPASAGPRELLPLPRPNLVVEFEPRLIERLQQDLAEIAIVAAAAVLILIAFAFALSRIAARLSAVQELAERERRLVALGRASSVIAHELRNPLATMKGHAQLLVEDLAEPSRTKALRVVDGAERLERLTSVLLDFVRDGPLDVQPIAPAQLVERALADLPRARVKLDLSAAPDALELDAERTSLALRNLIQNGIQASPADAAPVEVRVGARAREVVIEVRDHGPGLAPGTEAQIFDPFVTTKTRGTGLGLSIARRIAEQHGGRLTAETHHQGGAVFRLVLPQLARPA